MASPLYYSISYGHQEIKLDTIDYLISLGADVTIPMDDGDMPMHMGGYNARVDVIKTLLKHGADINIINKKGETLLYVCIKQKDFATNAQKLQAVQYMLAQGATLAINAEFSIMDLANQHLPDAVDYLEHPESLPSIEKLELGLVGDLSD